MLAKVRVAESFPWDARRTLYWRTVFPAGGGGRAIALRVRDGNPAAGSGLAHALLSGASREDRYERVVRTAIIPKYIDIFLRKEETSAIISAMRNSIAETSATAPTNPLTGAMGARFCNQNGFLGTRGKIFV